MWVFEIVQPEASGGAWKTPSELPLQFSRVEVETYEGKLVEGTFLADNNWQIPGYSFDLFNSDIVRWRYI